MLYTYLLTNEKYEQNMCKNQILKINYKKYLDKIFLNMI